jgi:hypothetical protein
MRWIAVLVSSAAMVAGAVSSLAQVAPSKPSITTEKAASAKAAMPLVLPATQKPVLPDVLAGWVSVAPPKTFIDAAEADGANSAALKEYDFTGGATANYKRSGETLSLRALHFHDASGAYGAYSFYRQNGWPKEEIGTGATSNHNRVIFWVGNTVIDANFSRIGPMSGAELRELAAQLPVPEGSKALAPPVLANLPSTTPVGKLDGQTTHYAVGAASYAGSGGVLPPELVNFNLGAETATANYSLRSGVATLTVIDYPTPQMAAAQETKIRAYIEAAKKGGKAQPTWPKPLQDSDLASLEVRRSGPLVAIVAGDAIPDESHNLLAAVHFEANLTSIPQPTESEVNKTGKLLLGITVFVIVTGSAAILLGFFLGGFRALYRISRGKPASSVYDIEFTSLNLRD